MNGDVPDVHDGPPERVAAVILAAGASTRLGEPKQMVTFGSERLLERAVRVATEACCEPVVVVLGAFAEEIALACNLRQVTVLHNSAWREGMASSIRLGIAAIKVRADAVILMTCDQPAVSSDHLRRLIAIGGTEAAASSYDARLGTPAYFPADRFPDLLALGGDAGARGLLSGVAAVELPNGELDIDTPETLHAARLLYAR